MPCLYCSAPIPPPPINSWRRNPKKYCTEKCGTAFRANGPLPSPSLPPRCHTCDALLTRGPTGRIPYYCSPACTYRARATRHGRTPLVRRSAEEALQRSRDKARAYNRRPDVRYYAEVRRARKWGVEIDLSLAEWTAICQEGPCNNCGTLTTGVDHVRSLFLGGPLAPGNLRRCCLPCNRRKGWRSVPGAAWEHQATLLPAP